MKWIVGLGNPGKPYSGNRHNVGFMAIDRFAARHGIAVTQSKYRSLYGEGFVDGRKVALLKPQTYMNLSGEAVRAFLDYTKSDVSEGLVIYDDLDTPFGAIRLRYQGGAGGHNGIRSLIAHLGGQTFNRVRVGISRPLPGVNIADYVLNDFSKAEAAELARVLDTAVEAMESSLEQPFEKVMAQFN